MTDSLLPLLVRIASGELAPELIGQARVDLAGSPLATEVDVSALFTDDPVGDAQALIDTFGPPGTAVAAAIDAEAGVARESGAAFAPVPPIADAVRAEAGPIDVSANVMVAVGVPAVEMLPEGWLSALLDRELPTVLHVAAAERVGADVELRHVVRRMADAGRELREGISREAGGPVSLWPRVAQAIGVSDPEAVKGWDGAVLREAVQSAAGPVDLAARVMEAVRKDARAPEPTALAPANPVNWALYAGLAVAMAAVLLLVPRLMAGTPQVVTPPVPADFVAKPVAFAAADEINVDRIQYGGNASVFVETPDAADAPLILWIDDGADL